MRASPRRPRADQCRQAPPRLTSRPGGRAAGGDCSVGANWISAGMPASGDDVDIALTGSYTVILEPLHSIRSFVVDGTSSTHAFDDRDGPAAHRRGARLKHRRLQQRDSDVEQRLEMVNGARHVTTSTDGSTVPAARPRCSASSGLSVAIWATDMLALSGSATISVDGGGSVQM